MKPITKKDIEQARKGLYDVDERFDECGFVYIPGGRVAWQATGTGEDTKIELHESWGGTPRPEVVQDIMLLLALYVRFNRQQKEAMCPGSA